MESVSIATKFSKVHYYCGEVYSIPVYVIKFAIYMQQICTFFNKLQHPSQMKVTFTI